MDWNFPNIYNWNTAFGTSQVYPGKFASNIDLHMGEGLFCFQNDGSEPCSAIWKRNERTDDLLPVWEQVSWVDGTDSDGNCTVLSTPYMLENFQTNKLGRKLIVLHNAHSGLDILKRCTDFVECVRINWDITTNRDLSETVLEYGSWCFQALR